MKILDFLIITGVFSSKNEAAKAVKNKITLKINSVDVNDLNGDIFVKNEELKIIQNKN